MADQYEVVIVGSGAGGGMAAYMLTAAGARVAVVEAGGHNIDRDIRRHQWPWKLPYRNEYQRDPVNVKFNVFGRGLRDRQIIFDGSARNDYYNDHFFVKLRDWKYTHPEGKSGIAGCECARLATRRTEQGACRMGEDRKKLVTNRWGQCHDVPNLILRTARFTAPAASLIRL